jgi:hypothetical protein
MKLEASNVGNSGGMEQVQTQLSSLIIKFGKVAKGKEK